MKHLSLAVATLAMLTSIAGAWAATGGSKVKFQSVTVTLPTPGGFYTGASANILNANCVTCHTAGFAERQPTLSLASWTMEITKMKKAFGAPINDSDIPLLAQAMFARQAK